MDRVSKKAKEADVESRIVTPLLTNAEYLGIPHANIRGKTYLYPRRIKKAAGKTSGYYPDFSIWIESFPLFIVEAKSPAVDVAQGYLEASQYALHLNRQYEGNIDPCGYVIATNGQKLLGGCWNADPEIEANIEDVLPGSTVFERLKQRVGFAVLVQRAAQFRQIIDGQGMFMATRGSQTTTLLNSTLPPNQFSIGLVPTLARFFASPADDSDPAVYDTAYVPTNDQLSYDSILENLLRDKAQRHKNPLSKDLLTTKTDTRDFSSKIAEYSGNRQNTPQMILVVGHVGAGKSLFIRRYRKLQVPPALRGSVKWAFLNFNDATKADLAEGGNWTSKKFVESFSAEQPEIDLNTEDMEDHIFGYELNANRSLYARLERVSLLDAIRQKVSDIARWKADYRVMSRGITRYFGGQRGETCIVVFDNVDRLDKDDQLTVFQLALAFMADHRTLTILQMRDETFERYKDSKPLDTFKTGISFHILPPRFGSVVRRRLEISIEEMRRTAPSGWDYELSNGARVHISRDQALAFLQNVYDYVFREGVNASRVLQGLAGRDVRRALDIFFRVLISGHLSDDSIMSVALGGRAFPITDDLVLRTLMCGNNQYFHSGNGFVANIFFFEREWRGGDNLLIIEILFFLGIKMKTRGTIGIEGFFTVDNIFETLQFLGYPVLAVRQATDWLLQRGLVEADNMSSLQLARDASIRISSAGFIHVRVLSTRLEYVAACLYEIPYLLEETANEINEVFVVSQGISGLSPVRRAQAVQNFRKYVRHLERRREKYAPNLVGVASGLEYILPHLELAIAEVIRPFGQLQVGPDPLDL